MFDISNLQNLKMHCKLTFLKFKTFISIRHCFAIFAVLMMSLYDDIFNINGKFLEPNSTNLTIKSIDHLRTPMDWDFSRFCELWNWRSESFFITKTKGENQCKSNSHVRKYTQVFLILLRTASLRWRLSITWINIFILCFFNRICFWLRGGLANSI